MYFLKKILKKNKMKKVFIERLTEPLHLNLISFFVLLFGTYRQKINFDLIIRPQYAYGVLKSADMAKALGMKEITVLEFGVASGAGLMNMSKIAEKVTEITGVKINVFGFDTGMGMPKPIDYRDHPDLYQEMDFPMNFPLLKDHLAANTELIIGHVKEKIHEFMENLNSPIGFVAVDLDYYSSTKECLKIFSEDYPTTKFLPIVNVYFDDIALPEHNSWCGELLALKEFNQSSIHRKIERDYFLDKRRVFKNAIWLKQIYQLHVFDHHVRRDLMRKNKKRIIGNPYVRKK